MSETVSRLKLGSISRWFNRVTTFDRGSARQEPGERDVVDRAALSRSPAEGRLLSLLKDQPAGRARSPQRLAKIQSEYRDTVLKEPLDQHLIRKQDSYQREANGDLGEGQSVKQCPGAGYSVQADLTERDLGTPSLSTVAYSQAPLIEDRSAYQPLDPERQEIRVLKLVSGDTNDRTLYCQLEVVSLATSPDFSALSYAWGDEPAQVPLTLAHGQILITPNLESALRAIREKNAPVSLWVDAICINQNDIYERNYQVRLMRSIYTSATTVQVWLGPQFDGADDAFLTLERLSNGSHLLGILLLCRSNDERTKVIPGLLKVFEYAWWNRLWVIQEVILAKHATVRCGPQSIDFFRIMKAFENL